MLRDAYGQLATNSYPSKHPVAPRVPPAPWCVFLADESGVFRLLCFDFDGKKGGRVDPDLMEAAVDDADALSGLLEREGVAHVVCESSSTGGRHVWVSVPAGVDAGLARRLGRAAYASYRTLDHGMLSNVREGAARPPLSPHRNGSTSRILRGSPETLLHSTVTTADLERVAVLLEAAVPAVVPEAAPSTGVQARGRRPHRALSRAGETHMATVRGGENPSWTGFMCLLSAAHAGWSFTDVQHAAKTAPGMEHYRTKNTGRGTRRRRHPREALERLRRQWDRAQTIAAQHALLPHPSRPDASGPETSGREPVDVDELTRQLDSVDAVLDRLTASPGRWTRSEAGQSDRSVLTAIAYLTLATGKPDVAASIRSLALLVGLGRSTVAASLHRLTTAGLLTQVSTSDDSGNAARWQLPLHFSTTISQVRSQPIKNPRPPTAAEVFARRRGLVSRVEGMLEAQRHDVFTRPGLGHLAGRAYAMLQETGVEGVTDAAARLGSSRTWTARALSRLRKHRLIVRDRATALWRAHGRDLRAAAADTLGVRGLLERRAARYRVEREVWEWWMAELDVMHTIPRRRPRRRDVTSRPLFTATHSPGERAWPRYPRDHNGRAEHRAARHLVDIGALRPDNRWSYLGDAA